MSKMSDNFYKIKKKHLVWAIVKSLICGISFGLAIVGILLLALKLSAIDFAVLYYVLIGVGAAILGGGLAFLLLFRPTDKKVARRTDDDYKLNERVQTTLAYSDREGTVIQLQREDTEEKIKTLPRRKFSFARIWRYCVVLVVALAIGAAGIFVPAKEAEGDVFVDPDSTPREVTEFERAGVRELISDVQNSYLKDELKSSVVVVLEQLLSDLDVVNTVGTVAHAVNTAIDNSGFILSSTLSYIKIGEALEAEQPYLNQAVTNGGNVYQYYMLTTSDEARAFYLASYDAANPKVINGINAIHNNLAVSESGELSTRLSNISSAVSTALDASLVSTADSLYNLLESFAGSLSSVKADIDRGTAVSEAQNAINDIITPFIVNLTREVSTQAYNAAMKVFVSNRLKIIFGYLPLELPIIDTAKPDMDIDTPGSGDNPTPDPDDPPVPPPPIDPEQRFGSDDEIWVPGIGYVKYGEVIDDYYNLINQYLRSEELTEEQKNMIRTYYDILFGSHKNN